MDAALVNDFFAARGYLLRKTTPEDLGAIPESPGIFQLLHVRSGLFDPIGAPHLVLQPCLRTSVFDTLAHHIIGLPNTIAYAVFETPHTPPREVFLNRLKQELRQIETGLLAMMAGLKPSPSPFDGNVDRM